MYIKCRESTHIETHAIIITVYIKPKFNLTIRDSSPVIK